MYPVIPYQCANSPRGEVVATVIRKISSSFSIFGSYYILATVWKKWREKKSSIDPYQRIVVGMSIYDFFWTFFPWFMGSWMVPAETGWWGAVGNQHTCSMQGFFFWLGVPGALLYQMLLSVHTLLLVTYQWKPRDFEKKIERRAHVAIFVVSITLATIPLFFQAYNPECGTCLPAPLPIGCGDWAWGNQYFGGDGETECIRGNPTLSEAYYSIYLSNIFAMSIICTSSMIMVYRSVRRQEDRVSRYLSFRSEDHRRESKRIKRTMILYTVGFFFCWVIPSIIIHSGLPPGSPANVISYILLPLQGFFNMLVFIAPKCAKYQRQHPGTWLCTAYVCVIFEVDKLKKSKCCVSLRRRKGEDPLDDDLESDGAEDDGIGFTDYNEDPRGEHVNRHRASVLMRSRARAHQRQHAAETTEQTPENYVHKKTVVTFIDSARGPAESTEKLENADPTGGQKETTENLEDIAE